MKKQNIAIEQITKDDLTFTQELNSREYLNNSMSSNASNDELARFKEIKSKLKGIARYFSKKYNESYGPFKVTVSSGNPIMIGKTKLNRIWSGLFKGTNNKQYSAQISFVMNSKELCLDVGFYFGSASGHSLGEQERNKLEYELQKQGINLSKAINKNEDIKTKYNMLFDFGFKAFVRHEPVLASEWIETIKTQPKNTFIICKVYPNSFNIIDNSVVDSYVGRIIFLMGLILYDGNKLSIKGIVKSPEQVAMDAFRLAEIGQKGEEFIMKYETNRLQNLGIRTKNYPDHKALESPNYGYDILSLSDDGKEIYIEVKTTTKAKTEKESKKFFLSTNEYNTYLDNKERYRLYRVYDVENNPNFEIIDLEIVEKYPDGYIIKY